VLLNDSIFYQDDTARLTEAQMSKEHWCNDNGKERLQDSDTTCPSTAIFTTNPTQTGLSLTLNLHTDTSATNGPSSDAANIISCFIGILKV